MTAVENDIQSQLDRVAMKAEGGSSTEEEDLEKDTTQGIEKTDESGTQQVDSTQESTNEAENGQDSEKDTKNDPSTDDETKKQASAFAAMRKRLKELEEENKTLKQSAQQTPEQKKTDTTQQDSQDKPDDKEGSDNNLTELQKRIEQNEKYINQLEAERRQQKVANEVMELQQKYNLDADAITEFADELERRGVQIGNAGMPLVNLYAAINHDKIVQSEIERVKKEVAGAAAPKTGPTQQSASNTKSSDNVQDTIARVAKRLQ